MTVRDFMPKAVTVSTNKHLFLSVKPTFMKFITKDQTIKSDHFNAKTLGPKLKFVINTSASEQE